MSEVSDSQPASECVYFDTETLLLQQRQTLRDFFGLDAVPGEQVTVRCNNCPLSLRAKIGWNVTVAVYSEDPDGVCRQNPLRPSPNCP